MSDQSVCCPWCGHRFDVPEVSADGTSVCVRCEFEFKADRKDLPDNVLQNDAYSESGNGPVIKILLVASGVLSVLVMFVIAAWFVFSNDTPLANTFASDEYSIQFPEGQDTVYSFYLDSEVLKERRNVSGKTRYRRVQKGHDSKTPLHDSLTDSGAFNAANRLSFKSTMLDHDRKHNPVGSIQLGGDFQPIDNDWEFRIAETIPFVWLPVSRVGIEPMESLNRTTWETQQQGTVEFQGQFVIGRESPGNPFAHSPLQQYRLNGKSSSQDSWQSRADAIKARTDKMIEKMEERRRAVIESNGRFRSADDILERLRSRNRDAGILMPPSIGDDPDLKRVIEDARRRSRIGINERAPQSQWRTDAIIRHIPIKRRVSYEIETESDDEIRVSKLVSVEPASVGQTVKLAADLKGHFVFDKRKKLVVKSVLAGTAEYEIDQIVVKIPVNFSYQLE